MNKEISRLGLLVICTLLTGCAGTSTSEFPDDYLVDRLELPKGLHMSSRGLDWPSNPYHMPHGVRDQCSRSELCGYSPEDQWVQAISGGENSEPVVAVDAAYWDSRRDVTATVDALWPPSGRTSEYCTFSNVDQDDPLMSLWYDDHVVVLFRGLRPHVFTVIQIVEDKADSLESVC